MWEMMLRVDEVFAAAMLAQMKKEVLEEDVLHGDDTPVPVRLEDEKGTRNARVWAWVTLGARKAVFDFTLTKERDGPVNFLGDWKGTLILDGASNFNEVVRSNEITRAGCWAHARRKLKTAFDRGSKDSVRLLVIVQRLFWIERAMLRRMDAREGSVADLVALRQDVRTRRSRRLIEKLYEVAEDLTFKKSVMPKSELGKALTYLSNQRDYLGRFLEDARIPIHNNDCERALRHLVTGRKNWLVFGSPRGGQVACHLYSLMLSCRAIELDPEAYMRDVLSRLDEVTDLAEITPWAWAAQHPEAHLALA